MQLNRFCVGDRFYLCENKILCEYDYEERRVFANMACSPGNLDILRRQVSTFQVLLNCRFGLFFYSLLFILKDYTFFCFIWPSLKHSVILKGFFSLYLFFKQKQPGPQSEQQQQPQQQFNSSSSSIVSIVNQCNQFDQQQHKYTLNVPFSKVPISEPLSIGSYSSATISPPPSSSSDKHSSQTGYITKQTRVKERTDPFLILKSNPNLTSLPPSKRPKQSYSTYDNNNDNLDSAPPILYAERNNNHNFENLTKSLTFSTSSNLNPFLQSVRTAEDHASNTCKTVKVHSSTANSNYNAIGSPDSGIVEGTWTGFYDGTWWILCIFIPCYFLWWFMNRTKCFCIKDHWWNAVVLYNTYLL